MRLVAGIDSSTQSCKVTVRDVATGVIVREGKAAHPDQTIVHPEVWWQALLLAVQRAGGLQDVVAISVSGQQHTPIFLDEYGEVVCESPLWNDTGSHPHMLALNDELGREEWIKRTGLPLTLSDTVVKARWLRDTHPEAATRTAAIAVVHDWLTWRLMGYGAGTGNGTSTGGLEHLTTDRSEASGTGYWSPESGKYCDDLITHALGHPVQLPRILEPTDRAGLTGSAIPGIPALVSLGVGSGDNAAAALALGIREGDTVLSLGTSGVVYTRSSHPVHDYDGYVCNYADATGEHLPIVATLNAARNLHLGAQMLGCTHAEFADLALSADPGAGGLTMLPFFEGERTPDLPHARASLQGASLTNFTRANFARAVIEGTLASQVAMLDYLRAHDLPTRRLLLIGGAAHNAAVQQVLCQMVTVPVVLPAVDEYVTKGAAMQAVAALEGHFPSWPVEVAELAALEAQPVIADQRQSAMAALGYDQPAAALSVTPATPATPASQATTLAQAAEQEAWA